MVIASDASSFYRAFEDRHRGTRELITGRLQVYLPFIKPLTAVYPALSVLDIGCGRGEWLELLRNAHIPAHGVDLDDGMLAACAERGLSVAHIDAIDHLKTLGPQSLLAVTGFHIAEHLPFAELQTLLAQAFRVLAPGGLLILETPNPENLLVGAANFYIDPTHQRPLPSQLLIFLAEHQGFASVKLLRLQEEPRLAAGGPVSLYDVLANVSPDYAIVAKTATTSESVKALADNIVLTDTYMPNIGVSLPDLANRYDQHLQDSAQPVIDHMSRQTVDIGLLKASVQQHAVDIQQHAVDIQQHAVDIQQAAAQLHQLGLQINSVYASTSWRITRPLRWLAEKCRGKSAHD